MPYTVYFCGFYGKFIHHLKPRWDNTGFDYIGHSLGTISHVVISGHHPSRQFGFGDKSASGSAGVRRVAP